MAKLLTANGKLLYRTVNGRRVLATDANGAGCCCGGGPACAGAWPMTLCHVVASCCCDPDPPPFYLSCGTIVDPPSGPNRPLAALDVVIYNGRCYRAGAQRVAVCGQPTNPPGCIPPGQVVLPPLPLPSVPAGCSSPLCQPAVCGPCCSFEMPGGSQSCSGRTGMSPPLHTIYCCGHSCNQSYTYDSVEGIQSFGPQNTGSAVTTVHRTCTDNGVNLRCIGFIDTHQVDQNGVPHDTHLVTDNTFSLVFSVCEQIGRTQAGLAACAQSPPPAVYLNNTASNSISCSGSDSAYDYTITFDGGINTARGFRTASVRFAGLDGGECENCCGQGLRSSPPGDGPPTGCSGCGPAIDTNITPAQLLAVARSRA